MSSDPLLRFRRSAAQLHALAEVERTIRATDTTGRRQYLRDFSEAFQAYRQVLQPAEVEQRMCNADVILVGDYHALPASQFYTAALVEKLAATGRRVILGVEAIVARDQHILDEWQRGEIDGDELRSRIRFETEWGYDWRPFRSLLERARATGAEIFGLDCTPRQDMRSIRARDRHAAVKIDELRTAHPDAVLVVLFGESHLAPSHLPLLVRSLRGSDGVLTVLQNVDSLYWLSAGEPQDLVEAVEVRDDVLCVFSATPLEKYEHYRLSIERWKQERAGQVDLAPSFYNLITSLLQFLNVNPYSAHSGRTRSFLVDELPEVWCAANEEQLERLLARRLSARALAVSDAVRVQGSYFVAERNVIVARDFRMPWAAEQAARFVYHACHGTHGKAQFETHASGQKKDASPRHQQEDSFYSQVLESALGFLGSKILCPSRKLFPESEICEPRHSDTGVHMFGHALGSDLYSAYIRGDVSKRWLRGLFFKDVSKPGSARAVYMRAAEKVSSHAPKQANACARW